MTPMVESEHSLRLELEAAASDPLFLADIQEIEEAFRSADAQTIAMLDSDWIVPPAANHP
ncbi:MAG: hypothetical protein JWL77_5070 [Chthonomonadaceae bacterium]|nr:hypothetical protein [Chthonomonadaceae bacterium]